MSTTSAVVGGPRHILLSSSSYADAQQAVDALADAKFPVENLEIVGSDLHLVERVTGRVTTIRAAGTGAAGGIWFGLLVGIVFWIVSPWTVAPIVSGIVLGAVFGAIFGAIAHASSGGRRDFDSLSSLQASRYDVVADADHADEAARVLAATTGARPAPARV